MKTSTGNRWMSHYAKSSYCAKFLCIALCAMPAYAASDTEYNALRALYLATNGTSWIDQTGWSDNNAADVCNWFGVTCDPSDGHVAEVLLPANGLTGTLPDLSGLSLVHYLDFDDNEIGGQLPSTLGSLTQLDTFHAQKNQFSGPIPDLSSLNALQEFIVPGNRFSGALPDLSALSELRNFDVSYNYLSGTIPPLPAPSALRELDIEHNAISGNIPSLQGLSTLTSFKVGYNHLYGQLPPVPSPNRLNAGDSTLCPNALIERSDADWDKATGELVLGYPWYQDISFPGGFCGDLIFSDSFEERVLPF